jgi:hypothetical protein
MNIKTEFDIKLLVKKTKLIKSIEKEADKTMAFFDIDGEGNTLIVLRCLDKDQKHKLLACYYNDTSIKKYVNSKFLS